MAFVPGSVLCYHPCVIPAIASVTFVQGVVLLYHPCDTTAIAPVTFIQGGVVCYHPCDIKAGARASCYVLRHHIHLFSVARLRHTYLRHAQRKALSGSSHTRVLLLPIGTNIRSRTAPLPRIALPETRVREESLLRGQQKIPVRGSGFLCVPRTGIHRQDG